MSNKLQFAPILRVTESRVENVYRKNARKGRLRKKSSLGWGMVWQVSGGQA